MKWHSSRIGGKYNFFSFMGHRYNSFNYKIQNFLQDRNLKVTTTDLHKFKKSFRFFLPFSAGIVICSSVGLILQSTSAFYCYSKWKSTDLFSSFTFRYFLSCAPLNTFFSALSKISSKKFS